MQNKGIIIQGGNFNAKNVVAGEGAAINIHQHEEQSNPEKTEKTKVRMMTTVYFFLTVGVEQERTLLTNYMKV